MQGCIEHGVPFPDVERILAELAASGVDGSARADNTLVLPDGVGRQRDKIGKVHKARSWNDLITRAAYMSYIRQTHRRTPPLVIVPDTSRAKRRGSANQAGTQ